MSVLTMDQIFVSKDGLEKIKLEPVSLSVFIGLEDTQPILVSFHLSLEDENAVLTAEADYEEKVRAVLLIPVDEIKEVLLDCVNNKKVFEESILYKMAQEKLIRRIQKAIEEEYHVLVFKEEERRHIVNGLGTVKYKGEIIGFFEGFTLEEAEQVGHVKLITYLPTSPSYKLTKAFNHLEAKFYNFEKDEHYIFDLYHDESIAPAYEFHLMEISSFSRTHEEVARIYKAYQTPYAKESEQIASEEHMAYVSSRMNIIKEIQDKSKKEAITSRFSGINF